MIVYCVDGKPTTEVLSLHYKTFVQEFIVVKVVYLFINLNLTMWMLMVSTHVLLYLRAILRFSAYSIQATPYEE